MPESPEAETTSPQDLETLRLDKWLWTARFFKTRNLAAQAVTGGRVQVEGERVKPSRRVRPGDRVQIRRSAMLWDVVVRGLVRQRRPAKEAILLYEESAESLAERTSEQERRRQVAIRRERGLGRPTKRDRRDIDRLKSPRLTEPD